MFETICRKRYAGRIINLSVNKDPSILQHNEMKNYYKIIHLESGVFNFILNNKDYVITGAHVLCINERDILTFIKAPADSVRILLFKPCFINTKFNFDLINESRNSLSESEYQDRYYLSMFCHNTTPNQKVLPLDGYYSRNISERIDEIERMTVEQDDPYWLCRSRTCFFEILFSLTRQGKSGSPGPLPYNKSCSKLVSDIIYYLQSCYSQKISISSLSNRFHTNRTTLTADFKNFTGQSINRYLLQLRLMMASTLLRETGLSIDEIRERTGFSDTGYFSKVFKRNLNYSPSEYRRIHMNK